MKKIVSVILMLIICINMTVMVNAENSDENKIENNTEITTQAEKTVENILDEFNNDSDELQQKVDNVIEKNSNNLIIKLFKSIINAITKFLDAIFEIAL